MAFEKQLSTHYMDDLKRSRREHKFAMGEVMVRFKNYVAEKMDETDEQRLSKAMTVAEHFRKVLEVERKCNDSQQSID